MGMVDRVRQKALELLLQGRRLSKMDLAEEAPCHQRTAQRVLQALHSDPLLRVYVSAWDRAHQTPIPVYAIPPKRPDAPRPEAMTSTERAAKRRLNPVVRQAEAAAKRIKRSLVQAAEMARKDPFYKSIVRNDH